MRSFFPLWLALMSPMAAVAQTNVYIQTSNASPDDLYIAGRYEEALAAYRELYEQSGDPEFLFKMARSLHQLGQKQAAIESYRAFLLSSNDPVLRQDAERYVSALGSKPSDPDALVPLSLETSTRQPVFSQTRSGKLFRISATTGAAGLVTGAATVFAATSAQRDIAPGDEDVDLVKFAALAALTDALVVTSISTGVAGLVVRKRERRSLSEQPTTLEIPSATASVYPRSKKLFRISGATAVIGLGAGLAAMIQQSQAVSDGVGSAEEFNTIRSLAMASDALMLTAAGTGVAGLVLRKKERQSALTPIVSLGVASLQISW
jgi:tetratricopeptide (TPR) repeat protein